MTSSAAKSIFVQLIVVTVPASLLLARAALALTACTAADIAVQDPGCPVSGACTISKSFTVNSGCTLDFSTRAVTLAPTAVLTTGSGVVSINADSLTLAAGALIDGRGTQAMPPLNNGGTISITTTNDITLQKSGFTRSRIDVSAMAQAGMINITAGGKVNVAGRLDAIQLSGTGDGGSILVVATGDIVSGIGSEIAATGGYQSAAGGGSVELDAGGNIDLGDFVDVSGSSAGSITLCAGSDIIVRGLQADGTGDTGDGGDVTISAGQNAQILGQILARGSQYNVLSGGSASTVTITTLFGNLTVGSDIRSEGAAPDGDGGEIDIAINGSMTILSGATVSGRSNGLLGYGGVVCIDVGINLTSAGLLDASGGGGGGCIDVTAKGDITSGAMDATGRYNEGTGGAICVEAGFEGHGTLTVGNDIDASGGPCDSGGCGDAGSTDLLGCDLTVTATGRVLARAPGSAGENDLTAREQLRVDGTVSATTTLSSGADGVNLLIYPTRKPPVVRISGVQPAPLTTPMATCSATVQTMCLVPCPTCGDGTVEYPEQCDGGNAVNCDGCSSFCEVEPCGLSVPCSGTCDPMLGCPPPPTGVCANTPTPTPSATFPATPTQPPAVSPTPTRTLMPGVPTRTPTNSPPPTHSPSPTSIPSPTRTPTTSPTATSMPTATRTPTSTSTRTASPTPVSTHDAVVAPMRPLNVTIPAGQPFLLKTLTVKVTNADVKPTVDLVPRLLQLVVTDGDCPAGTVDGLPDFDALSPGAQDTAMLTGGRSRLAAVPLRIATAAFTSLNRRSPTRCTLTLDVHVILPGNQDPTPENNFTTVEINVYDPTDSDPMRPHQTVVKSVVPLTVSIPKGKSALTRPVRVYVTNADTQDVDGHAITVKGSDGDCPTGTLGSAVLHRPNAVLQDTIAVENQKTKGGTIPVTIHVSDFPGSSLKSPRRCTALLVATGPSGDLDVTNNVTLLVIDVIDLNQ